MKEVMIYLTRKFFNISADFEGQLFTLFTMFQNLCYKCLNYSPSFQYSPAVQKLHSCDCLAGEQTAVIRLSMCPTR